MRAWLTILAAGLLGGCAAVGGPGRGGDAANVPVNVQAEMPAAPRQAVPSEEALIPYSDVLTYSTDWVQLSRRRESESQGR